ncbi:hypothetical protein CDAR_615341 [Caerostris darwini]|uniref:Uncharacterized protein n=1 Tax=Caerostris darwini TaxID=1538125 RepID=A0AAV4RVJ8_9ARAC|nr:hypothetical protein CDAR_615341 [Caerostris darwini]
MDRLMDSMQQYDEIYCSWWVSKMIFPSLTKRFLCRPIDMTGAFRPFGCEFKKYARRKQNGEASSSIKSLEFRGYPLGFTFCHETKPRLSSALRLKTKGNTHNRAEKASYDDENE